ncbi:MAG: substrate-binding domain-containing protein [Bacillota bacterium]
MISRKITIGVITKYTEDSYFGTLLDAIHQTLLRHNANMFIIKTFMISRFITTPGKDSVYFALANNHVDGWIIICQGASNEYIEDIQKTGKPIVLISYDYKGNNCSVIMEDNLYGAEAVTQHLIDHGHRRIAFVGWFKLFDMVERYEGYKQTLFKNGIDFDPDLVIRVDGTLPQSAINKIQSVIKKGLDFTAVFAANDHLALGTMEVLKRAGFSIPKDIAVIGYDNIKHARNSSPSLTSMDQNILDKGIVAAENLIKRIKGETSSVETIYIRSNLVLRNSCGCEVQADDEDGLTKEKFELKDSIIKGLEKSQERYYHIGSDLLTTSIDEIKRILPNVVENYSWECIGFWEENSNQEKELYIQQVIDLRAKKDSYSNIYCPIEDFPPKEFLPDSSELGPDDIVWILPISSSERDWGIISYISPIKDTSSQFAYDTSIILFNLLGIAMDRELANSELKKTLDTLQQTQEQLIHSEKMVSLGGLVAGVAHEINTPIGVSVTAASYLEERSGELMELFQGGKLKRVDLERYLESSIETLRILSINLSRASNLISSFKQIAVDQSVEEKRRFRVKEYINEVLLSLNPKLKKTGLVVSVQCPDDLEIYSYPGGLSQIITNLVVNSIIHAYNEGDTGNISINIYTDDNMVNIIYSDDGKGIDKKDLGKIFDPFFTTKRGSGGTGLGLNIVYNIVTQEYGGNIKCSSEQGKGTTFTIKFPIREV